MKSNKAIVYLTLFLYFIILNSCASLDSTHNQKNTYKEAVFNASYEKTWKAAEKSLENYVLANNNSESGIIQTEWVKGDDIWIPPTSEKKPSSGQKQKLTLFFTRGKSGGVDSVRVQVKKDAEILSDFLAEPKPIISDGLEELNILYRIERELSIDKTLTRLENKKK